MVFFSANMSKNLIIIFFFNDGKLNDTETGLEF